MQKILNQENSNVDMIASHLRSQLVILHNCLEIIERTNSFSDEYVVEAFKHVESQIRRLRVMVVNAS
jgi:hypothetical protein